MHRRARHAAFEPPEPRRIDFEIVCELLHRAALAGRTRLDAVRKCDAPARTHEVEAALEPFAAGEREGRIDAVRCDLPETVGHIGAACVDDRIGTEAAHERLRLAARGGGDPPGAAVLPALERPRTHPPP